MVIGLAAGTVAAWVVARGDVKREVEGLLAEMSRAVMSADAEGYLKLVDLSDPTFAMEQRHWADDLKRQAPVEFELGIAEDAETAPVWGEDRAELTVRLRYKMKVGHASTGKGKSARWPAVFAKIDPDGAGPEPARWVYQGEKWLVMEGTYGDVPREDAEAEAPARGRFVVKFMAGAEQAAQDVLKAFPVAKAHVDEGFGVRVTDTISIKLYSNMEHLKATVYLSMPDEVLGGWNEPGESVRFMWNYTAGESRWTGAFAHEYGHYATWTMGPRVKEAPWWMQEGVAELAAEGFTKDRERIDRTMRRKAAAGTLCAWEEISDYDKAAAPVKVMAYWQGHHLMGYVSERWGRQKRNEWIRGVANGKTVDASCRAVFGLSFDELDQEWRASIAEGRGKTE